MSLVPSANMKRIEFSIESRKSFLFTWTRNRSGPKILHCGTPEWTGNESHLQKHGDDNLIGIL